MAEKPTYEALERRISELEREVAKGKKPQDAVGQSESKYRILVENLPQKIFHKDRHSVYMSCNENLARDLKIKPEEIQGKTDYDFFPRALADKYRADDRAIMDCGETRDIEEHYIEDGNEVYVHTVKTPVRDEQGNVTGVLGIFWDIAEQKGCQDLLVQSERTLRALLDATSEAAFLMDTEGTVLVANRTVAERLGRRPDDLISANVYDLLPRNVARRRTAHAKEAVLSAKPVRFEDERDGKIIANTVYPVFDQNGKVSQLAIYATDITAERQAQEALRQEKRLWRLEPGSLRK